MKKIISSVLAVSVIASTFLTGCGNVDKNFASDYVAATMDASYKGEFNNYMKITVSKEQEVQEIYDNTIQYYTESIAYYCEVYTDDISEELNTEYTEFTKDLLSKAKYTVSSAENGKESCYVKISIKPINLLEQAESDIQECVDNYNNKLEEIGQEKLDTYTDAQYQELEDNYAKSVLDALKKNADNLEYKDNIDFTMEIRIDEDGLYAPANEDDWNTIDDYIMGIYE